MRHICRMGNKFICVCASVLLYLAILLSQPFRTSCNTAPASLPADPASRSMNPSSVPVISANRPLNPASLSVNDGIGAYESDTDYCTGTGKIVLMFWNCENFFDYLDEGTGESDTEFSSRGARRWTKKRFLQKCNALAKAVLWTGSKTGRIPDVVGLEEIENRRVLTKILSVTALRKLDYEIVHYDSPDHRGIDCALLYRSSVLRLTDSRPCHIFDADTVMATRDLLLAQFVTAADDSLAVAVCHLPSKYSGEVSDGKRIIAMNSLRFLADSLKDAGWRNVVAAGDFNDVLQSLPIDIIEPSLMPVERPKEVSEPPGSIRFNGKWELIDMAFASEELLPRISFRVLQPPFLTQRDAAHGGEKPLRTYSGPRWLGGVSDHYPIVVLLE